METSSFSNIYKQVLFSASLVVLFSSCTKEYVHPQSASPVENSARLVTDQKYDPNLTSSNGLQIGSEMQPGKTSINGERAPKIHGEVAPNLHPSTFSEVYMDQKKDEIETRTDGKSVKIMMEQKDQNLPISTDRVFEPDFKKKELKSSPL
jgi:hypothetical protein